MESIENQLKTLIQSQYKSLREFSNQISMPYSTMDSIFKRGVGNASVSNIIRICQHLNISADKLAVGEIQQVENCESRQTGDTPCATVQERHLLALYHSLNDVGQQQLIEHADTLVSSGKYK